MPQTELLEYCTSKGIKLEAYSPLGSTNSPLLSDEVVVAIAEKHQVATSTVLISWQVSRGVIVLPKSVTPSRLDQNIQIVKLDKDDMEKLNSLSSVRGIRRFVAPDWGVDLGFDHWTTTHS